MNREHLAKFTLLVALMMSLAPAWQDFRAQTQEPPPVEPPAALSPAPKGRPKIGLALSGGGARGAAHIGVLRVLEELHVPVDYIAGTSMGAIVGGLYATGMSPDDIQNAIEGMDWDLILTGRPPRRDLSFRRKEDEFHYPGDLEMGLKGWGVAVPMGFISGQNFEIALSKLTRGVARVSDFDQLPIPFHCTATDIVTGESIVLSKGDLARAIRASMSLPGIFPPVDLDGRLLVDGGLKNNLPVDVVKAMGADIVIAVNIGTPPATREELNSYFAVTGQMFSILQEGSILQRAKMADLLIQPDLQGISMTAYEKMGQAIAQGTAAAHALSEPLSRYAIPSETYFAQLARQRGKAASPLIIDQVRFEGDGSVDQRAAERRITVKPGQPLDLKALQRDLTDIWDIGDYESVTFSVRDDDGKTQLFINALPKQWGPNYLKVGLNLQTDLSGNSYFNILAGVTKSRINALGAEWRSDLQVGRTNFLFSEFYQPLNYSGRFFVSAWGEFRYDLQDIYLDDDRIAQYATRQPQAGLDLGLSLGKHGEIRVGPVWRRIRAYPDVGISSLPSMDEDASGLRFLYLADQLDNASFPNAGRYSDLSYFQGLRGMGSAEDYRKAELSHTEYFKLGKSVLEARIAGGSSFGTALPPFDQFSLGGLFSLSGYKEGQLRGNYYGTGRLGYFFRTHSLPAMLGRGVYLGGFLDAGNTWWQSDDVSASGLRYAATLFLGIDTRLGPLYLAYGHAKDGNYSFYLSLGRSF